MAAPLWFWSPWALAFCASVLGFPAYYYPTTYKNLTDLKAESFLLSDTFVSDPIDQNKIAAVRLKMAQAYEYEKGKGDKKDKKNQLAEGAITKEQFEGYVADIRDLTTMQSLKMTVAAKASATTGERDH